MGKDEFENTESLFSLEDLKSVFGPNPPEKPLRKRKIILIIDDDFYIRIALEDILKQDFDILTAEDGEKGCYMLEKYQPDLVLLDLSMPKLNGKRTLQRLREKNSAIHIPIIVLSANPKSDIEIELKQLGIEAFLQKPVPLKELLATISSSLKVKWPASEKD